MNYQGGCLCGAVRYQATAEPLAMRLCWCRDCQYLAAGNATANVVFPSEAVTIKGTVSDYTGTADSGNVMHRKFCPTCGTPLFSQSQARPHLIIIRAGTLDEPQRVTPSANIWTESAPSWACFDETLPNFPRQPPPAG